MCRALPCAHAATTAQMGEPPTPQGAVGGASRPRWVRNPHHRGAGGGATESTTFWLNFQIKLCRALPCAHAAATAQMGESPTPQEGERRRELLQTRENPHHRGAGGRREWEQL